MVLLWSLRTFNPQFRTDLGQRPLRVTTRSQFSDGEMLLCASTEETQTRHGVGQKFSLELLLDGLEANAMEYGHLVIRAGSAPHDLAVVHRLRSFV